MSLSIIILAAGMGTRMKSAKSKVMHEVAGLPMVKIIINLASGFSKNITVIASEENKHDVASLSSDIKIAIQKDRLGTGHSVQQANNKDGDKVLILYGDTPLLTQETISQLINIEADIAVLGFENANPQNRYGRLICDGNHVKSIVEYKDASDEQRNITICNSGVFVFKRAAFDAVVPFIQKSPITGEIYLTDAISMANEKGFKCKFILCDEDEVLGVNNREELSIAENIIQTRLRKHFMAEGVTMIDPSSVFFSLDTKISNDVLIEPNVVFGKGVQISSGVHIKAFSHIEGAIIGKSTTVGPFARIRSKTTIGDDCRIGNFVEVKNASLGNETKAGHLAYIGDADIAGNVNIGAGTVFCNYDGFRKHRSTVGHGTFVGSNSSIISPIEIGENAMIAAGSVITKNVETDAIAIERSEQRNVKGGSKRFRTKAASSKS